MFLKFSLLVLLQFLLGTFSVLVPNPCQRPSREPGDCKPLKQCAPLYANIDQSQRIRNYIWHSHCGFDGDNPKVCCPLSSKDTLPSPNATLTTSSLLPGTDICGLPKFRVRPVIFGGVYTNVDEFPWMAALEYTIYNDFGKRNLYLGCGGSLISKRYVLTAAHCVEENLVSVRLGEWNTETDPDCDELGRCAPSFLRISIEKPPIVFKTYKPLHEIKYHDVALLRLAEEVTFSDYVKPICLPTTVEDLYKSYVGHYVTVAGWGLTEDDVYSHIQLKVDVPVQNGTACRKSVDEGQLCAGGIEGKASCFGDSGGPLVTTKIINGRIQWFIIGVVSGGPDPCGQMDKPAYYARVSKYLAWIVDNLKP